MEGGTKSSKSGGRGEGLSKRWGGHDSSSLLLWKPCVVSKVLMELWKMNFSHLNLLYLMCLTLWISPASSLCVFSLGPWGLWLPRGCPLWIWSWVLGSVQLWSPEPWLAWTLCSFWSEAQKNPFFFLHLADPSSWGRKEDEGVSVRFIVSSRLPLGKECVCLRQQDSSSPQAAKKQAWGYGSKHIFES